MILPDLLAGVLSIIYKENPDEWIYKLSALMKKVESDKALPALSVALPRFARHTDQLPTKDLREWQKAVEKAYNDIFDLNIGMRMSGVVIEYRITQDKNIFLKLPLEERVLAESLFE